MSQRRSFLRDNSLTLVMLGAFVLFWVGQSIAGYFHENAELTGHGRPPLSFLQYLTSSAFLEATFENWESEFLQMGALVAFAAFLHQRGSGESKDPDEDDDDKEEELEPRPGAPGPVLRGGLVLKLYSHSLSAALLGLFALCFVLHAMSGAAAHNEEAVLHGQPPLSALQYVMSSGFWFESLQNWQSEFLSVAVLTLLSIRLREKGSPESKAVNEPHSKTGK